MLNNPGQIQVVCTKPPLRAEDVNRFLSVKVTVLWILRFFYSTKVGTMSEKIERL